MSFQALAILKDEFVRAGSRELAPRLAREAGAGSRSRVIRAFETIFARPPSNRELDDALVFCGKAEGRLVRELMRCLAEAD